MPDVPASIKTELEKRYRTAALVVGVQILITLSLIGAAFYVSQSSDGSATAQAVSALWVIILIIALGTVVLRRFLFSRERLNGAFREKGISGALETLQTNTILLGSIAEIITVFGFLIAVFGDKWDIFRVGVIALIIFLVNFPRLSQWRKIVADLENSRGS